MLITGRSQKQVARELGIAYKTVRTHTHNAREKTGCFSTIELAIKVAQAQPD